MAKKKRTGIDRSTSNETAVAVVLSAVPVTVPAGDTVLVDQLRAEGG